MGTPVVVGWQVCKGMVVGRGCRCMGVELPQAMCKRMLLVVVVVGCRHLHVESREANPATHQPDSPVATVWHPLLLPGALGTAMPIQLARQGRLHLLPLLQLLSSSFGIHNLLLTAHRQARVLVRLNLRSHGINQSRQCNNSNRHSGPLVPHHQCLP